jgi:hypothetical protein
MATEKTKADMAPAGKPQVVWTVTLQLPIPRKLARRCTVPMLAAHLAKRLGEAFRDLPPGFVVQSAEKIKADMNKPILLQPTGIVQQQGAPPFKM